MSARWWALQIRWKAKKQNIFLPGAHCAPLRCGKRCCRSGKWLVDPVPTGRNGQDRSLRLPGTFCTIPPLRRRGRPMCLPAGRHCEFAGKRKNKALPPPFAHCAPIWCWERCCRSGKWSVDPVPTGRNGQDHSLHLPGTFCTIPPLRRRGRPMCLPAGRHCEFAGKRKNRTSSYRAHTVRPYGVGR